jgi:hypothetical protein
MPKFRLSNKADSNSLGGWKPEMIPGGLDVMVNYEHLRKTGYYEATSDRATIARRIELPEWASSYISKNSNFLSIVQSGVVRIPEEHSNERQGHIYWRPTRFGWSKPALGVDEEIFKDWVVVSACREIVFVVYEFGKKELERWRISKSDFVSHSKIISQPKNVEFSATFVPQRMICVTDLKVGGISIANKGFNSPFENL